MALSDLVNTFGIDLVRRYGERIHKLAIHAGFTCPNRDGSKGTGGCTFCNNASFSPNARREPSVAEQIAAGRRVVSKRTGAARYLAYFQAYTNTYGDIERLGRLYREALAEPDVIGLSVGTRPDCLPEATLDLLAELRDQGHEIWLELGLQSSFNNTLERVNRGHGWREYEEAVRACQARGLPVCTHLIVGLPGETRAHNMVTLERVLELGTQGLKLHPLHVVKHTLLAHQWKRGGYQPLSMQDYIDIAADLIEATPESVLYHRVTGTASADILLAPDWCSKKWAVLNGIENALRRRGTRQGSRCVHDDDSLKALPTAERPVSLPTQTPHAPTWPGLSQVAIRSVEKTPGSPGDRAQAAATPKPGHDRTARPSSRAPHAEPIEGATTALAGTQDAARSPRHGETPRVRDARLGEPA